MKDEKAKRCAVYARVSTKDKNQNNEVQLRDMRKFVAQRNCKLDGTYQEKISSKKTARPEWERLRRDAREHRFDVVLVWKFDRAARTNLELVTYLEEFKRLGVEFASFNEQFDTSTPAGKMMFTMLSGVAEMERNNISDRVKAGLRLARAKGIKLGGKRPLRYAKRYGRPKGKKDTKSRKGKYAIDMLTVYRLRSEEVSYREIAEQLGVPFMAIFNAVKHDKKMITTKR